MKTNKSILSALVLTSLIGGVAGATTVTDNDINVGQGNTNNASYTMSVGLNNSVNSRNTIAVGEGNYVNSEGSRVGGYQNSVVGNYSNVTGYQNHVNGTSVNVSGYNNTVNQAQNGLVFGNSNTANGENTFVGGENATADGRNAFAYGASAYAQAYTFAMGTNATAKAADAIALGNDSKALGATSIAVGLDNTVKSDDTIAIGAHNGEINAIQSVVTGYNNQVVGTDPEQLIYGSNSKTSAQGAIVVGTHSEATAMDATVIGNNAIASVPNSVAIGTNSTTELGTDVANIQDGNSDIRFKNIDFAGSHVDSVVSFGANGTAGYGGVSDYKRQLQNVAAGRVNATSTDAINGSQLYDTALEAQKHNTMADGTNTTVTATDNNYGRKEYKVNVNADLNNMSSVNFGAVTDSVHNRVDKNGMSTFDGDIDAHFKADGVYLENRNNLDTAQYTMDGMRADSNGKSVAFGTDGINAGNQVVSGVDTGVADTDAVNVAQLKKVAAVAGKETTIVTGTNVNTTTATNASGGTEYTIDINRDLINMGTIETKDGNNHTYTKGDGVQVTDESGNESNLTKEGLTATDGTNTVTFTTTKVDVADNRIQNVADAVDNGDAVNFKQLKQYATNAASSAASTVSGSGAVEVTTSTNTNGSTNYNVALNTDRVRDIAKTSNRYAGDDVIKVERWSNPTGSADLTTFKFNADKAAEKINIGYTANGGTVLKTTVAKGFNFVNGDHINASVAADGKVKFDLDHAITDQIDSNTTKINNLENAIHNANGNFTDLIQANQKEARRGIASASALAALHPLDYDPDHKTDIMVGAGHFRGTTAIALGAAYRPSENIMFTIGASINGKDTAINAGVSYKVGTKVNGESRYSKVAMQHRIDELNNTVAEQNQKIEQLNALVEKLLAEVHSK